jgi:hypothetical protein
MVKSILIVYTCLFCSIFLYAQNKQDESPNKKVEYDSILDEPEEVYRTSDDDKEKPTWKKKKGNNANLVLEGERVGCECMNGELSYQIGSGACTNKGGVRFWVYRKSDNQTYKVATLRHLKETGRMEKSPTFGVSFDEKDNKGITVFETLSVVAICALLMYVIKVLFDKKRRDL